MNTDTFDDFIPVTLNGDTDLTALCPLVDQIGLYVTGAGNLVAVMANGQTRTIPVQANSNVNGRIATLLAATTATGVYIKKRGF